MHTLPCLNRSIRLCVSAFLAVAAATALVRFAAGGPEKVVETVCSSIIEFGEQGPADPGSGVHLDWPEHPLTDDVPTPEASLAEGSSPAIPHPNSSSPGFSSGRKVGLGNRPSGRQRRPETSSRPAPHRFFQILLCRWVI
ncbi:MAG: hypothetical protein RBS80_30515 [Thermoguttaceae bacterium]|jgi:hypothetical protein|nr:hypothetical protein [Thermoguttaceae bacterium]